MSEANFIAVDLGASSGRVLLGTFDGERFRLSELWRFPNGPVNVLGNLYWNVLDLWQNIKIGLAKYDAPTPLISLGVDTWGVDYALLDASGALLGNPYHYRDARTRGGLEKLYEVMAQQEIYARTGIQFLELNTLTQLHSASGDPHLNHAATLLMMPDLLHYWLSGEKVCEYTNASTTQLLNAETRQWDRELINRFGLPKAIFPRIVPPGTMLGSLRTEVAQETGLDTSVKVVAPATHDTGSAVAAVPHLDEKSVYLSSGTWSLIGVEVKEPIISDAMLRLNFTNEGGVNGIRVLKNVAGMWLLEESRRQWEREGETYTWVELLGQAERAAPLQSLIDPDAPAFAAPGDLPSAIRTYCQETGQHVPTSVGALVRCCLESLALRYRQVIEGLENVLGHPLETIRIVGGGSQNALLNQLTADACQKEVVAGPAEATALGNLMMQAVATGYLNSVAAGRRAVAASVALETYQPRGGADWDEAFERFEALVG